METFMTQLLEKEAIDRGKEGELYSRLILTIAHDVLMVQRFNGGRPRIPDFTFTVGDFLCALYSKAHHQKLDGIDPDILQATMNFLSFSSTCADLHSAQLKPLCYSLLRRTTALQFAPEERTYSQLLPFYTGNFKQPFDFEKVGCILIRVNRWTKRSGFGTDLKEYFDHPQSYNAGSHYERGDHDPIVSGNPATKVLILLFDFGLDASSVDVSISQVEKRMVCEVYSRGRDHKTFGCLETLELGNFVPRFFHGSDNSHDILCRHRADPLHNILYQDSIVSRTRKNSDADKDAFGDDETPEDVAMI